jgi:hypothetical protein
MAYQRMLPGGPYVSETGARQAMLPGGPVIGENVTGAAAITGAGQIATAEAFGSPTIGGVLDAAGIATAEAFGQPAIAAGVEAVGIASAEAFGGPALAAGVADAGGIASQEVLGQPTVTPGDVAPSAPAPGGSNLIRLPLIPREWVQGRTGDEPAAPKPTPQPAWRIAGAGGIDTAEALGAPTIGTELQLAGIASAEAMGRPVIALRLGPRSIPTAGPAVGDPLLATPPRPIAVRLREESLLQLA